MKISAVIPTHNRCESLARCLTTLSDQQGLLPQDYETVVVVDGSTDGTIEMLRGLRTPHKLVVVVLEENQGLAAARNAGANKASGEIVLFLDDDFSCNRGLLSAHLNAHQVGDAEKLIIGLIRSSEDKPFLFASEQKNTEIQKYFESTRRSVKPQWPNHARAGANCSMRRSTFFSCDGYDELHFARYMEDVDLGVRLWKRGVEFRFDPSAIATHRWHNQDWKQFEARGAAAVSLCQKYPELRSKFGFADIASAPALKRGAANFLTSAAAYPIVLFLRRLATLSEKGPSQSWVRRSAIRLHQLCRALAALTGARRKAGSWRALLQLFGPRVSILLYHDVGFPAPTAKNPNSTIRPSVFERHMRCLRRLGYTSISPSQWLDWIEKGAPLPDKPVLLTFDDAYENLADHALPILVRYGFTATIFVITARSSWGGRPLMTMDQIKHWFTSGFEIGGHSRTHPKLAKLDGNVLEDQVSGCRKDLEEIGIRPQSFAYPHGSYNKEVRSAAESNFRLAFTTKEGLNDLRTDLFLMRRTEVRPSDTLFDVISRAHYGWSVRDRARAYLRPRSRVRGLVEHIRQFYY